MNGIEINNLDFAYKKKEPILSQVNMNVPKGSIYGFLGSNGAGKTTTLKLILNLLKNKSKGCISIMGDNTSEYYPSYLHRIGSLIENASIYSHLSARDNMKIWSNYHKIDAKRNDEVLEIIGLTNAANKKARDFSTGMKQRLGLGIALIHDPEILILDEPTNGLDPMGINDLRKLLQKLRDQGKTILLSSHILSEVEKLVDHVGIIKNGSIVFEGSLEQLNNMTMLDSNIMVSVNDTEKAMQILQEHYRINNIENQLHISISSKNEINHIVKLIIDNNIGLHEVVKPKKSLETIFLKLVN